MSHAPRPSQTIITVVHFVLVTAFLAAGGGWLTSYLVGTLVDPLDRRAASGTLEGALPTFDNVLALTERKVDRFLGEWEFSEPHLPGHFHHIGRWYQADNRNFCIDCHGPIPHSRSADVRAFLNMHNLFITCQVCHTPRRTGEGTRRFGWVSLASGGLCRQPDMSQGAWGEYGAKIIPLEGSEEDPRPLKLAEEEALATQFRERMSEVTSSQKVQVNKAIHGRCDENPVRCVECHTAKDPYLPFDDLGYAGERAAFLVSAEVVDLVQRYEKFHLPNLLKPSKKNGSRKKRETGD